jgi:hypothetical protein
MKKSLSVVIVLFVVCFLLVVYGMRWSGHVEHMGEMKNAYSSLVGKLKVKRLLGRPRHRW